MPYTLDYFHTKNWWVPATCDCTTNKLSNITKYPNFWRSRAVGSADSPIIITMAYKFKFLKICTLILEHKRDL